VPWRAVFTHPSGFASITLRIEAPDLIEAHPRAWAALALLLYGDAAETRDLEDFDLAELEPLA